VAFASPYPGKLLPMDLSKLGGSLICQKDAFLCAAKGVSLSIAFQKKLGAGFFGGEGFIVQKLEGDGMAFVHAGGTMMKRDLGPGETLRVDTGCWWPCSPRSTTTSSSSARSRPRCSAARVCSSPRCAGRHGDHPVAAFQPPGFAHLRRGTQGGGGGMAAGLLGGGGGREEGGVLGGIFGGDDD
jgi:hypothetical protein